MDVQFTDTALQKLDADQDAKGGFADDAVRGFRKALRFIRAAEDERDLRAMHSLHFEKLLGNRSHEYSIRLNKQWRLIFEIVSATPKNRISIKSIEDYH
jgi:proteic killer suppression protein